MLHQWGPGQLVQMPLSPVWVHIEDRDGGVAHSNCHMGRAALVADGRVAGAGAEVDVTCDHTYGVVGEVQWAQVADSRIYMAAVDAGVAHNAGQHKGLLAFLVAHTFHVAAEDNVLVVPKSARLESSGSGRTDIEDGEDNHIAAAVAVVAGEYDVAAGHKAYIVAAVVVAARDNRNKVAAGGAAAAVAVDMPYCRSRHLWVQVQTQCHWRDRMSVRLRYAQASVCMVGRSLKRPVQPCFGFALGLGWEQSHSRSQWIHRHHRLTQMVPLPHCADVS